MIRTSDITFEVLREWNNIQEFDPHDLGFFSGKKLGQLYPRQWHTLSVPQIWLWSQIICFPKWMLQFTLSGLVKVVKESTRVNIRSLIFITSSFLTAPLLPVKILCKISYCDEIIQQDILNMVVYVHASFNLQVIMGKFQL